MDKGTDVREAKNRRELGRNEHLHCLFSFVGVCVCVFASRCPYMCEFVIVRAAMPVYAVFTCLSVALSVVC